MEVLHRLSSSNALGASLSGPGMRMKSYPLVPPGVLPRILDPSLQPFSRLPPSIMGVPVAIADIVLVGWGATSHVSRFAVLAPNEPGALWQDKIVRLTNAHSGIVTLRRNHGRAPVDDNWRPLNYAISLLNYELTTLDFDDEDGNTHSGGGGWEQ